MRNFLKIVGLFVFLLSAASCENPEKRLLTANSYYFDRPAAVWEETIPLGNGRIGMMPDGGVENETIILNEITMWSGEKRPTNTTTVGSYIYLPAIRHLLFEDKDKEAQEAIRTYFFPIDDGNSPRKANNTYQLLGKLDLSYDSSTSNGENTGYRRTLNIKDAIASVSYRKDGVNFLRETFTSFANDMGVIYLTADKDRMINFSLGLSRTEKDSVSLDGLEMVLLGQLSDGKGGSDGLKYGARVKIRLPKGGVLKKQHGRLIVEDASEAVILVGMATDYYGREVSDRLIQMLYNVRRLTYEDLRRSHIARYGRMFDRVEIDFGQTDNAFLPIDQRLEAFSKGEVDPGLSALYFQFGRYLLMSSARASLFPPTSQGLWTNVMDSSTVADPRFKQQLQMTLWPAEVANLSELQVPLVEWSKNLMEKGQKNARASYNARGWVIHSFGNALQLTTSDRPALEGATHTTAASLCQHLYEHYRFTQDTSYLRQVYPLLKEAALFYTDVLVQDPQTSYLITAPASSIGNAYVTSQGDTITFSAGSTMDNQVIRELFTNTIESAECLAVDSILVTTLKEKGKRLKPTSISSNGRIMEWMKPYRALLPQTPYVSHLYGLYPGNQISVEDTPELAKAARKTLLTRGDGEVSWSLALKMNFWARLHEGERAYELLTKLLHPSVEVVSPRVKGTYPNLLSAHPPFMMDANLGGCAGIAEMLVQSQSGYIEVLPALPEALNTGYYRGLKVRGGGEVSAKWKNGKLLAASLKCVEKNHTFRIKLPEDSADLRLRIDNNPVSLPVIDGFLTVDLLKNQEVHLIFE